MLLGCCGINCIRLYVESLEASSMETLAICFCERCSPEYKSVNQKLSMTLPSAVRGTGMRRFDIRLSPQPASVYSRMRLPALQAQGGRFADTHRGSDPWRGGSAG